MHNAKQADKGAKTQALQVIQEGMYQATKLPQVQWLLLALCFTVVCPLSSYTRPSGQRHTSGPTW